MINIEKSFQGNLFNNLQGYYSVLFIYSFYRLMVSAKLDTIPLGQTVSYVTKAAKHAPMRLHEKLERTQCI
jgi:hypothetical protein